MKDLPIPDTRRVVDHELGILACGSKYYAVGTCPGCSKNNNVLMAATTDEEARAERKDTSLQHPKCRRSKMFDLNISYRGRPTNLYPPDTNY